MNPQVLPVFYYQTHIHGDNGIRKKGWPHRDVQRVEHGAHQQSENARAAADNHKGKPTKVKLYQKPGHQQWDIIDYELINTSLLCLIINTKTKPPALSVFGSNPCIGCPDSSSPACCRECTRNSRSACCSAAPPECICPRSIRSLKRWTNGYWIEGKSCR